MLYYSYSKDPPQNPIQIMKAPTRRPGHISFDPTAAVHIHFGGPALQAGWGQEIESLCLGVSGEFARRIEG